MSKTLYLFFIVIFLSACSAGAQVSVPTLTTTVAPAETTPPAFTPTQTLTPTITPSPTPYVPFTVTAATADLLLRTNPSRLFPVILQMPLGTPLLVLGKAPGSEWLYVQHPNGTTGWVFVQLVTSTQDFEEVPVRPVENAVLINGRVVDANGVPLTHVIFSVFTGAGSEPPMIMMRSDYAGEFFAFLPPDSTGLWTVAYENAYSCESNTVDAACNCIQPFCNPPDPQAQDVMLPQTQSLLFIWR